MKKINSTDKYEYSTEDIIRLIAKDLSVPVKAITVDLSDPEITRVTVNREELPKQEEDPYDAYRDKYGKLPSSMW